MNINTKIRYGLRSMIEIGSADDNMGVLQKDIAEKQDISLKYLDSIISALKRAKLIENKYGRGSGYVLTRDASRITMLDIYTAFDPIKVVECVCDSSFCDKSQNGCRANSYWTEFRYEVMNILRKKNLAQIIRDEGMGCNK